MATRLTPFSRLLLVLLILAALVFGGRYILQKSGWGDKLKAKVEDQKNTSTNAPTNNVIANGDILEDKGDVLNVQLFTFGNLAPGILFNAGLEPNTNSRFYKEYGLKVRFKIIDDFDASRQAFKSDEVHLFNNEVSAMAVEMGGLAPFNPQIVMQLDWSRGTDAVVVKRGINSMNDLKGKSIAYAPATPSQTLLIYMLDAANLKLSDVKAVEVPSAIDAETVFKGGKVDVAVVWDPTTCLAAVPGSKVLESTFNASNIIADVLMGKKEWIDQNKDKIAKFYSGWMKAVGEINSDQNAKEQAAKLMASSLNLTPDVTNGMIDGLRLTNHGDNRNFFGLDPNYKGVTAEGLYNRMGNIYESLKLAPVKRPSWRSLNGTYAVTTTNFTADNQIGEGQIKFNPATAEEKSAPAKATKPVSINFSTAQYDIDENAKTIIDLQFSEIAKGFANSRIRIEGNTDNVGNKLKNIELSRKRAESVAKYLQTTYGIDPNRFIIVGNGMDKPVSGCDSKTDAACRAKNRRTEFQLVSE